MAERQSARLRFILPIAVFVAMAASSCGGSNPNPNQGPVANAGGPYFTNAGQALVFNGSQSSAPSGQSLSYSWDFGDGQSATGVMPTHTYTNPGNFLAKLTVTDTMGANNSATVPVLVVPLPVSSPGGPYSGIVGHAITFNGSASTVPPGQNAAFSWNFGDSTTGSGAMPMHAYSATGTFTVTLSVKDDTGGVGTNTTTATITAGPSPNATAAKSFLAIGSAAPGQPRFAFVATSNASGENILSVNELDSSTGILTPKHIAVVPPADRFDLRGIALDPLSKFLYVVGSDSILTFSVDPASGVLALLNSTNLNGGIVPEGGHLLAIHPSGKFAYLPTQDSNQPDSSGSSTIFVFSVDQSSGALIAEKTVSTQIANPNFALIDPTGKFLFVSGSELSDTNSASTIGVFSIDPATGALTAAPSAAATISTRLHINAMATDTLGRFIYAVGSSVDSGQAVLSTFSVDRKAGALVEVPGSPFPVESAGSTATSVTLDPTGTDAFVLTVTPVDQISAKESIHVFALDATTGTHAPIADIQVAQFPLGVSPTEGSLIILEEGISKCGVADSPPSGCDSTSLANASAQVGNTHAAFMYAVNPGDAGVSVFSIDQNTGLLTALPFRISPPVKPPVAGAPQ